MTLRYSIDPQDTDGGMTADAIEKEAGACVCGVQGTHYPRPHADVAPATVTLVPEWPVDDMDGGVAAALIEKEAEGGPVDPEGDAAFWRSRAEKAEQEREVARARTRGAVADYEEQCRRADNAEGALAARPALSPGMVDDAMVERVRESLLMDGWTVGERSPTLRAALVAALAEPPSRPEGAEEIQAVIDELFTFSDEDGGRDAAVDLANQMAERGVRVTGAES